MPSTKTSTKPAAAAVETQAPAAAVVADPTKLSVGIAYPAFLSLFKKYFPTLEEIRSPADVGKYNLIILSGGEDIDPAIYGENDTACSYVNPDRDKREMEIFKAALKAGIKMYGSCRGHQLINVGMGGTLVQELRNIGRSHNGGHPLKWVSEDRGRKIREIFNGAVNSYHHQGIARLAQGLSILAEHNGVPEIVVGKQVLGTQFHPEMMDEKYAKPFFELLSQWAVHVEPEDSSEAAAAMPSAKATPVKTKVTSAPATTFVATMSESDDSDE